ncbi:hypothetical protein GCM10020000_80120 [Streptomyces olivoverticillatus]
MIPEGLDVVDLPVTAVRGRITGDAGVAGATQVEHGQLPPLRQSTEISEVGGRAHGPTGQAEQRLAFTYDVIGEFRSVGSGDRRHGAILITSDDHNKPFFCARGPRQPQASPWGKVRWQSGRSVASSMSGVRCGISITACPRAAQ